MQSFQLLALRMILLLASDVCLIILTVCEREYVHPYAVLGNVKIIIEKI